MTSDCYLITSDSVTLPESRQLQAGILLGSHELLGAQITWVVVAQIQLFQMEGVATESMSQGSTTLLCHLAARQPEITSRQRKKSPHRVTFRRTLRCFCKRSGPVNTACLGLALIG